MTRTPNEDVLLTRPLVPLLAAPLLAAAALLLSALPTAAAAGEAFRCTDRNGQAYTLPSRPEPSSRFFVACEMLAAPPAAAASDSRAEQLARWRQSQSVLVSWPAQRETVSAPAWRPTAAVVVRAGASAARAAAYLPVIRRVAESYNLDPHYLKAVMHTESAFNRHAVSPKGAVGLMQLMPATAERFGVSDRSQLHDPDVNVEAAARYLAYLRRLFADDWTLITAAYNAGEGAVRRYGNKVPPFAETQHYVRQVEARLVHYSGSGW